MSFNAVQTQKFTLAGSGVTSSATSVIVNSFDLPDDTAITQVMFGTTGYGTLEPGTSKEESISWTGVTANGDGTSTLTGVIRGKQFQSPYAEDSDLKFSHAGSTVFVVSNTSAFYDEMAIPGSDETITGDWTFDNLPKSGAGDPTDDEEFARKAYVDAQSGGSTSKNRTVIEATGGEVIVAGEAVYFDVADSEWKKADKDTEYISGTKFGIAQGAGTDAGTIASGVLVYGLDATQTGMTPGAEQYIGDDGALTETEPTNSYFIGTAEDATTLIVDVQADKVILDSSVFIEDDNVTQAGDLDTQTVSTNSIVLGEADTTLKKNSLAQTIVHTKTKIRGVKLFKKADTGTFTGDMVITLQTGTADAPSGTPLATATILSVNWLQLADDAEFEAIFASEYASYVVGDDYCVDIQPSTADNSNHPNLGADTATGDGTAYYNNTTDGWVQNSATSALYFKTMEGNIDQVVKADSTGKVSSDLISRGLIYDFDATGSTSGVVGNLTVYTSDYMPAELFSANSGLKVTVYHRTLGGSDDNTTISIQFNGVNIASDANLTGSTRNIVSTFYIKNEGATNSQSYLAIEESQTNSTDSGTQSVSTGTTAVEMANGGVIDIILVVDAIGHDVSYRGCVIEVINT